MAYYAFKKDLFDINKVTVVGSPSITSDGVASGFTASDYIRLGQGLLTNANTWELEFDYDTTDVPNNTVGTIFNNVQTSPTYSGLVIQGRNYIITLFAGSGSGTTWDVLNNISIPIQKNAFNKIRLGYNGTKYYCFVNGVEKWSLISNVKIGFPNGNCTVGYHSWWAALQYGSINLPSFKIYVDNQLVFQPVKPAYLLERRKEGYDPSKFTIVGSPTITEYGVASGFSGSNYLTLDTSFNLGSQPWSIDLEVITGDSIGAYGVLNFNSFSSNVGLVLSGNTNSFSLRGGNQIDSSLKVKPNSKYSISFGFDGTNAFLTVNGIKNTVTNNYTIDVTKIFIGEYLGQYYWSAPNSSINLPSISITVDGKEVFTGAKEVYYAMEK